jgi:hypothetical protein
MFVWALLACVTEPRLEVTRPACQADYLTWGGGLTEYVQAGGGGGDFDVDPAGELETRAFGNYELSTGDFVYTLEYDEDHYRTETRVEGYGYAETNGDLDLEAVWTTTDVLDARTSVMKREIREGCSVESTELDIYGREWVTEGRFIGAEFDYTRTGPLYDFSEHGEFTGVLSADLSLEESVEIESDGVEYSEDRTDDGEGNTRSDWVWDSGSTHQEGSDSYDIEGTWTSHVESDASVDCTIDREVDYEGDGDGTMDCSSGLECDLTYNNWVCSKDCSDGTSGNCATSASFMDAVPKVHLLPRRLTSR